MSIEVVPLKPHALKSRSHMQQTKHSRTHIWLLTVVPLLVGFVLQGVVTFSAPLKSADSAAQNHTLLAQAATADSTVSGLQARIWMPVILLQSSAPIIAAPSATPPPTATITPLPAATITPLPAATVQPASGQHQILLPLIVHESTPPEPGSAIPTTIPTPFPTLPPIASPTLLPTATATLLPTASPIPRVIASPTPAALPGVPSDQRLLYGLILLALCIVIAALLLWLYVHRKAAQPAAAPIAGQHTLLPYRLDAAFPDKVAILQAFDIAIAIRHLDSKILDKEDLAAAKPRAKQIYLPSSKPYAQLSIQISAQQCDIKGGDLIEFRLYQGEESAVFAFQIIPRIAGFINIIITIKEKNDIRAEIPLLTRSIQRFTEKPELKTISYEIKADLGHFLRKRLQELQEQQSTQSPDMAPHNRIEIDALQKQLEDLED